MNPAFSTAIRKSNVDVSARVERALRAAVSLVGVALIIWAVSDARFRHAESSLAGPAAFPLGAGAGILFAAWALRALGLRTAFWTGLLFVGQAATLQLI